ncbi:MAG: hypothetical protein ACRDS9_10900 [Pseudonocardiaceae bacterium]
MRTEGAAKGSQRHGGVDHHANHGGAVRAEDCGEGDDGQLPAGNGGERVEVVLEETRDRAWWADVLLQRGLLGDAGPGGSHAGSNAPTITGEQRRRSRARAWPGRDPPTPKGYFRPCGPARSARAGTKGLTVDLNQA